MAMFNPYDQDPPTAGGGQGQPSQAYQPAAAASGLMGGGQAASGGGYHSGGGGGLNSASGGNFFSGLGNAYGLGKPTTPGHYGGPQVNRNDYFLGGSQQAANGLLGASDQRAAGYAGRATGFDPSAANANLAAANGMRGDEQALTRMLQAQAAGQGPSVAVDTYNQAAQDATKRAQSLATSARGGAGLLGARQAAELGFEGTQNAANQAGMIRKQEMLDARGLLGQQLAQRNQAELARGGLGLDISRTGTGFDLQSRGLNDAAEQAERGRYLQMLQLNQGGAMNYNQQQGQFDLGTNQLNSGLDQTNLNQQNAQDAKRRGLIKKIPILGSFL